MPEIGKKNRPSIPKFPVFKKLELSDKEEIEKFASKFPFYSTFNFINLWAWNTRNDRKVTKLNGNLVFLFTDYNTKEPFLSFLGTSKCKDTALQLLHYAEKNKILPELRFITEESTQHLRSNKLKIEEDRNNFDYMFSIKELAELKGKKFNELRHLASKFSIEYPDVTLQLKNLHDISMQKEIHSVLRQWEAQKKIQNKKYDLSFEEKAINRLLKTEANHQIILSCLFSSGVMIGFSIDELLPRKNVMAHFIKANNSFKGIYEFLNRELAQHLMTLGITHWNWQQDLGLERLRETKMGYRPVAFLKKHTISLVNGKIRKKAQSIQRFAISSR